ncbi:sigma-70 family RNA polymerase sigma factor [Pseudoduganella sp. FT25W]|uniref:RNA polymerase sigma factor n=1 Tax=Duganella alba TaxID=2666081 RepID=A0A6L5QF14_9BURK|nr:RNA polymerase sigma factor [Duganella alba]MRX08334.1 sigma-70 family RNA polymerase sigma factor [Duganella alba]MRX16873.1 sigma-70 family RNA polymerase sigma factor [Duganella alba]
MESARIIALLARMLRDVGQAEELAQDALVLALERWPANGVPEQPAAWLMAVAKNRALDVLRHRQMHQQKEAAISYEIDNQLQDAAPDLDAAVANALENDIGDDLLRLVFVACHPVLSTDGRVALTLRMLGGLSTDEIARAFLVPEKTVAQRIVRAKRTLAEARVPFEAPRAHELGERLASVLQVIYLIYNEGYSASAGADWMRPALCEEALRLGRILAGLQPEEPEVHGLVALMEIQSSRARARVGPQGEPILLLEQDRSRWDQLLIRRGLAALERAGQAGRGLGPYGLQAAIAACHARARQAGDTDWQRIAALYDALAQLSPSPIVELNRAVALSMAYGPQAGLDVVDGLLDAPALKNYHLLPSVRGDLLAKLGRHDEARIEFERAASLTQNERERQLLLARATQTGVSADIRTRAQP